MTYPMTTMRFSCIFSLTLLACWNVEGGDILAGIVDFRYVVFKTT